MALHRRRRGERGASAVEFALMMPLLLLLVFGMIDFGYAINRHAALSNAAREGVRVASLGGTPAEINGAVTEAFDQSDIGVDISCTRTGGGACAIGSAQAGDTAVVTVDYQTNWLTPVGGLFTDQMTLRKTSMMRIE